MSDKRQRHRPVPGSGTKNGDKIHGLGRGAILQGASTQPKPGVVCHYKPVSVDDSPDGPPAIPGECSVHHSWRYLSNAPVAYQVQQMLTTKEDQSDPLPSFTPHSTTTTATAHSTSTGSSGLLLKAGQNVHGSSTFKPEKGGGNGLWEPWCPDPFFHPPPNVASPAEFPQLGQDGPVHRKKM